jgi:DNA-binding transcriptional LysR family regulator
MDLPQLRSFLAVADLLHFSKAALRVHLSQPALSAQIRRLEEELGVRLFERTHQKTTLTYAGLVYRDEARALLVRADEVVRRVQSAAEGQIGRIRIGFISTAAAYIVPPLVSAFRKTHPGVELDLGHYLTAVQTEMLMHRTLDVGFFRIPSAAQAGLRIVPVHKEPFKLFLPIAHPLAERPHLGLSDLDGAAFVIYARRNAPGFHSFISGVLQGAGVRPSVTYEASDMYTLVSLVSAGVGIAIAPASLVNYQLPDVAVRNIDGIAPSEIAVGYREDNDHTAVQAFLRLILEAGEGV